jgi:hypothetical protein
MQSPQPVPVCFLTEFFSKTDVALIIAVYASPSLAGITGGSRVPIPQEESDE